METNIVWDCGNHFAGSSKNFALCSILGGNDGKLIAKVIFSGIRVDYFRIQQKIHD